MLFDLHSRTVSLSRHANFYEHIFPYSTFLSTADPS